MNPNLIRRRLNRTYFIGRIIARLPFVRCVILNGSLASESHKQSSDIDILIIVKDGRIFTTRFFVNLFAIIFGIKRSKKETNPHAGKFCFNYFLTESFLKIPTGRGEKIDKYCAQNYSKSIFIAGNHKLYERFMRNNKSLFERYGYQVSNAHFNCHPERPKGAEGSSERRERAASPRFFTCVQNDIKKIIEFLFGNRFERLVKNYQIKKIESDPRTKKYPTLIVYNDKELRFHPPSHKAMEDKPS